MTGNTPTVLLGLGAIALTLPIGLLVLFLGYRGIERDHPGTADRTVDRAVDGGTQLPRQEPSAQVPGPRGASTHEDRSADSTSQTRGRATSA